MIMLTFMTPRTWFCPGINDEVVSFIEAFAVERRVGVVRDALIQQASTSILALVTDGDRYTYGNTTRRTLAIRPSGLSRALLIGFTRMGILHNLALLTEEAPPDHADGGVAEWVTVDEFEAVRLPQPGIAFAISVAGEPAGTASLDLDADGLPLARRQTVQFPTGEMHVTETYSSVSIEP